MRCVERGKRSDGAKGGRGYRLETNDARRMVERLRSRGVEAVAEDYDRVWVPAKTDQRRLRAERYLKLDAVEDEVGLVYLV